jgi:hypothetical protein
MVEGLLPGFRKGRVFAFGKIKGPGATLKKMQ